MNQRESKCNCCGSIGCEHEPCFKCIMCPVHSGLEIKCPGCRVDITPENAGRYRTFCETCVDLFPPLPDDGEGYLINVSKYPVFTYKSTSPTAHLSLYQRIKLGNAYRLASDKTESCRYCIHRHHYKYHDKHYHKCDLIGVSHSEATDIRLKNTCNKFGKKDENS